MNLKQATERKRNVKDAQRQVMKALAVDFLKCIGAFFYGWLVAAACLGAVLAGTWLFEVATRWLGG